MKRDTSHHKRVSVHHSTIAHGYGGERKIPGMGPGLWIIVSRCPTPPKHEAPHLPTGYVILIVAPARGGK